MKSLLLEHCQDPWQRNGAFRGSHTTNHDIRLSSQLRYQTSDMANPTVRESGSQKPFANSTHNRLMGWPSRGGYLECVCICAGNLVRSFLFLLTNRRSDPVPEMTTPEQFYSKVMETLKYLNARLPNGSHVILYGLPDGTFLWDHLHSRYHPLGIVLKTLLRFNVSVYIQFQCREFTARRNTANMPPQCMRQHDAGKHPSCRV